jgi:putative ABC transport system permease protein
MTVARMSLSDILLLYRARLRVRSVLVQELFAVVGISIGVALLFSSQVASTSLTRSVQQLTSQILGNTQQFQLDARGPAGVDQRLLGEVRRLPGVRAALPLLEVQANVIGRTGQRSVDLLGADPGFALLSSRLLRHFSHARLERLQAIALPAPVATAIGARRLELVKLQVGASVVHTLVGATLQESDIGGLVRSPVAVAPVAYVQRIAGMSNKITRIFVRPEPGREAQVRAGLEQLAATAGVNLEPGNFDSTLFAVAAAPERQGEVLFSAISAIVGFMFALNAMLVTVPSRRKLIEDVRPQGATRLMTVQILLFDAAVLGVLACILGLALGELLSVAVFHATPGYLASAFPVADDRVVTWQSVTLAVGAGLAAAVVGVLWPLRHILGRPLQAERGPGHPRFGWVAARLSTGFVCLAITTVVVVVRPQDAVLGNLTLVVALVCLLPLLFDGLVIVFERVQRLGDGAATVLAVTELQTPRTRVRSLAIAATAAVAVFGIVAIQGAQVNLQRGLDASARGIDSSAQVWVTPDGQASVLATVPFRDTSSRTLARVPGVAAVGLYRGSFLDWGKRRLWVLGPPSSTAQPIPSGELVSGSLALADARVRQGGWAVLSQVLAAEHHLHIGQAFTLPSPRPTTFRVAALTKNLGWPPGAIIVSSEDYARAWASSEPSAYEIQTKPGTSAVTVRHSIQLALGAKTGLTVETVSEREQRHYALASQGLSRLTQIRLLVLIAAVLAVSGAMGSMIWQRRDLVAFIKRQGYSRGVLWRWLLCEGMLLLGAGCSIGAVFGLYGQVLISHALASVTGFPILFNVGALIALSSFALVSLIALAIVALAGFLVVRVPPRTVSPAY